MVQAGRPRYRPQTPPPASRTPARRVMRADLTLALIALIWGATFVLIKRALGDVTPIYYLAIRFTLAAFLLAAVFHRRIRLGFTRFDLWTGLRVGFWLMLGYVLQTVGLQTTTP